MIILLILAIIVSSLSLMIGFNELHTVLSLQSEIKDVELYDKEEKRTEQFKSLTYCVIAFLLFLLLLWYLPQWFYKESLYSWTRVFIIVLIIPLMFEKEIREKISDEFDTTGVSLVLTIIVTSILGTMYFMQ